MFRSDDDMLELLRDFQSRPFDKSTKMSFGEWTIEKAQGRITNPRSNFGPGAGLMGHLNTSSYAPTGPQFIPPNMQGTGYNPNSSQYLGDRFNQPTNWISDVSMEDNWYSPFQPIWPFGPPYITRPREWDYPTGYNLNYIPQRINTISMLRGMVASWGVLATLIATRQDQLLRLPWTIQRADKPKSTDKRVDEVRKFFKKPDGKFTFAQWARLLMFELFVSDTTYIYLDYSQTGKVLKAEHVDGATIFPLIDDAGRRPDEYDLNGNVQPAYQQIIKGLPMINLSEGEVINAIMRPLPQSPMFGYSPIEQILVEATEAIRKTFYQLEFWREGSLPELIISVPDTWSPRQIAQYQGHFDALLAGNLRLKSRAKFVPGGMKPFDIKNASGESLWSQRDETLIRLACFAFSIPPTPFVRQTNRGTAQNAQQTAQEEGLYPLMSWWKDDIIDRIIKEKFGYDDIEMVFLPRPEVDLEKQAKIHQINIQTGEMTLDEARDEKGLEPYPDGLGAIPRVYLGNGVIPLSKVDELMSPNPPNPSESETDAPSNGSGKKPKGTNSSSSNTSSPSNSPQRGPAKPAEGMGGVTKATKSEIKDAAQNAQRNPDGNKKKAGNYRKGHIWVQGLNITIENAKNSKRGEKDRFGVDHSVKMPAAYGYIRGFFSNDNEQMDVYLGKKPENKTVWVIDQDKVDADGTDKGFDEHKVMLGYKSLSRALRDYLKSHYDGLGHERAAAIVEVDIKDFKDWLKHGEMRRPISEQHVGTVVLRRGDKGLSKSDTISTGTGLSWYSQNGDKPDVPKKSRTKKKKKKNRTTSRWGPRWLQLIA